MNKILILSLAVLSLLTVASCTTTSNKFTAPNLEINGSNIGIVYVSGYEAGISEGYISTEFLKKGANVIERARIKSILDEQKLQLSGLTDTENAIKIGALANVDYVFLADISMPTITNNASWRDNTWQTVSISFAGKLVDVETGSVLMSGTATGARGFADRALSDAIMNYFND